MSEDHIEYPPKPRSPIATPSTHSAAVPTSAVSSAPELNDVWYKFIGLALVLAIGLGSIALCALVVSLEGTAQNFDRWEHPGSITRYLASDYSEYMAESGIMNPSDDLNDPLLKTRTIVTHSGINEQTAYRISRKLLFLNAQNSKQPIDLYLATNGGWYSAAFAIVDTFQSISAPVNVHCIGGCYSSGTLIMAAATGKRIAAPNAHFSVHINYGSSSKEKNKETKPYSTPDDRVNAFFKANTTLPEKWFPLDDDRDYYLNAKQALKYNIIDEIAAPKFAPKAKPKKASNKTADKG